MPGVPLSPESPGNFGDPKGEEGFPGGGVAHRTESLCLCRKRPKFLGKTLLLRTQSPQSVRKVFPCPDSRYLRRRGRFLDIKSSLLSGVTPWRISGRESISVSRRDSILSNNPRRVVFRTSSWGSVFFLDICFKDLYLHKDSQSYRILQDITKYYRETGGGVLRRCPWGDCELCRKVPQRAVWRGFPDSSESRYSRGLSRSVWDGSPRYPDTT